MATHSGITAWRIPWTEEPGILGYSSQGPKELIMTEVSQPTCMPLTPSHKYCNTYKGHELVIKKPSAKTQRRWDIDGHGIVWFQFSIFTQKLLASKLAILIIFSQEAQGRVKSSSRTLLFVLLHSQVGQNCFFLRALKYCICTKYFSQLSSLPLSALLSCSQPQPTWRV